jgi:hypothetical protein
LGTNKYQVTTTLKAHIKKKQFGVHSVEHART